MERIGNQSDSQQPKKLNNQVNKDENAKEKVEDDQEENPLSLSAKILELAQKVFSNHLILSEIFENLPTKSLLLFRLVNKFWEEESTKSILRGFKTRVTFIDIYAPDSQNTHENPQDIRKLNECLRKPRLFPCNDFLFFSHPNLTWKFLALNEFLTLHGPEIKSLEINHLSPKITGITMLKIKNILIKAPNLENLSFATEMRTQAVLFREKDVVPLPNLKSLSYAVYFPQIGEIALSAPNLKEIRGYCIVPPTADGDLISLKKTHLLKSTTVFNIYGLAEAIKRLTEERPRLEEINLQKFMGPQFLNSNVVQKLQFKAAFSKLLECCKETVKSMELCLFDDFFVGVKWIKLEGVKSLSLFCRGSSGCLNLGFPPNFISIMFPNLERLKFDGGLDRRMLLFLDTDVPMLRLKEFSVDFHADEILSKLSSVAPNLEKLNVRFAFHFTGIASFLWSFKRLKQLKLNLLFSPECQNSVFSKLDMVFTGLSEEIVTTLNGDADYFNDVKIMKRGIRRVTRSILDCPDLSRLEIRIQDFGSSEPGELEPAPQLITAVTGEFGFKMLENLKVEISAPSNVSASLESIKPYVNYISRKKRENLISNLL